MASAHPPVRIVVLGDKGVGKTSLIATLVSEHFSAKPRDQPLPEVSIAGDLTNDNVGMTIVDTPSNPAHGTGLTEQAIADMRRADVAVLLYDTSDATTWQNINHHLDAIQSHMIKGPASSSVDNGAATGDEAVASSPRRRFPVVLVGNKIDLRDKDLEGNSEAQLQSRVASILRKYDFVEACLECSCKSLLNIETVFYFAQKAVVYPVPPLLQISDKCDGGHVLTTDFRVALNRVFRIFDVDGDGVLRDDELNAFQETCFGAKLQRSDVQNVKAVLSKASTPSMPFIVSDRNGVAGISRAGFMHLNQMFIERNRPETSWQVLRKFDYNDDVALDFTASQRLTLGAATSTAYANGGIVNPTLHPDQTVELSSFAFAFLERIFHRFASPHAAHVVAAERGLVPDTWRGLEAEDEEDESFDESFDGEPAWQLKVLRMQDLEAIFAIAGPNTLEQWWTGSGAGRASRTRENVICDPHLLPSAVCDWHFNTREPEKSGMKLAGWLAMWAAATMEDHMHVWYNLLCLGFEMPMILDVDPKKAAMAKPAFVLTERRSAVLSTERKSAEMQRASLRCVVIGSPSCEKAGLVRWLTNFPHHSLEKLTAAAVDRGTEKELAAALSESKTGGSGWISVINGDIFDGSSSSSASASVAEASSSTAGTPTTDGVAAPRTFVLLEERSLEATAGAPLRMSRGRAGSPSLPSSTPRFADRAMEELLGDVDSIDVILAVFDDLESLEYATAAQQAMLAHAEPTDADAPRRRCPPFVFVCDLANPLKQRVPERDVAEYESSGELVDGTSLLAAAQTHCEAFGLHRPLLFSASRDKALTRRAALYRRIVDAARFPLQDGHTPRSVNAKAAPSASWTAPVVAFLAFATVAIGGWFFWTSQQAAAQEKAEQEARGGEKKAKKKAE